jgi:hypothetical protein
MTKENMMDVEIKYGKLNRLGKEDLIQIIKEQRFEIKQINLYINSEIKTILKFLNKHTLCSECQRKQYLKLLKELGITENEK